MSPWRAQLACPPRAAGPHSNQGRQEAKSGSGSRPRHGPSRLCPAPCSASWGRSMQRPVVGGGRCVTCSARGAPPLARVHADPLGQPGDQLCPPWPEAPRTSWLCPGPRGHVCVCVSAQPAVELPPGRCCQGPGTSTTAQHEPDQPRVSGASEGMGGAESVTLLPSGSPALSTQPARL